MREWRGEVSKSAHALVALAFGCVFSFVSRLIRSTTNTTAPISLACACAGASPHSCRVWALRCSGTWATARASRSSWWRSRSTTWGSSRRCRRTPR